MLLLLDLRKDAKSAFSQTLRSKLYIYIFFFSLLILLFIRFSCLLLSTFGQMKEQRRLSNNKCPDYTFNPQLVSQQMKNGDVYKVGNFNG